VPFKAPLRQQIASDNRDDWRTVLSGISAKVDSKNGLRSQLELKAPEQEPQNVNFTESAAGGRTDGCVKTRNVIEAR
jgi:hypothetical protein